MDEAIIREARPGGAPGAYRVCLKTGNHGEDGEALYRDDPDALGRICVGPYLAFEPELSPILEDEQGICGYALGALDAKEGRSEDDGAYFLLPYWMGRFHKLLPE